ncbi:hypothetical protein GGI12_002583 [Dipsacomyces acuminosporus]|nr:hypothetical protein GGI12_002583 [Dipsacomyces acuminosporus]
MDVYLNYYHTNYNSRIFTYHNTSVYGGDALTLLEGRWLNDTILSLYFEYLTHDILKGDDSVLFLNPSVSHILRNENDTGNLQMILPQDICLKELILIPINNSTQTDNHSSEGTHWSLLVYVKQAKGFHYFDSLTNRNLHHARATKDNLGTFLFGWQSQDLPISVHSCPQQENNSDCGVFVILFVDLLARRYVDLRLPQSPPALQPRDIPHNTSPGERIIAPCPQRVSPNIQSEEIMTRPFSPFVQRKDAGGQQQPHQKLKAFRPGTMRLPVIERAFWWIDYSDLCNPSDARTTILELLNELWFISPK